MNRLGVLLCTALIFLPACHLPHQGTEREPVLFGLDLLQAQGFAPLRGKKVGLVTHPPAVDAQLIWSGEILRSSDALQLVALFGPEHGLFGQAHAGEKVDTSTWQGIPLYSLYGETRKPTPQMLDGIEVMVCDLQDIGVRSYTYISTLAMVMTACAERDLPLVVLDRPNPLGGLMVDGPMRQGQLQSFVSFVDVPYIHGLTMGEMARWINGEMLENRVKLEVVPLRGWQRSMFWPELRREWIPTSPHIPNWHNALFCAATGILGDLAWVNTGVGYTQPFQLCGAPWLDGQALAARLTGSAGMAGIIPRPISYTPLYAMYQGKPCSGVQLHLSRPEELRPLRVTLSLMHALRAQHPEHCPIPDFTPEKNAAIDRLWGSPEVMALFAAGTEPEQIWAKWEGDLQTFLKKRQPYLLYP